MAEDNNKGRPDGLPLNGNNGQLDAAVTDADGGVNSGEGSTGRVYLIFGLVVAF